MLAGVHRVEMPPAFSGQSTNDRLGGASVKSAVA
jgi:hypothetical protein